MDGRRFDALARSLATTRSRRRVLTLLAGGVLAPLAARLGVSDGVAACTTFNATCTDNADCCPGLNLRCHEGKCRCKQGKKWCGDRCCANCFVELLPNGQPKQDSEFCCTPTNGTICEHRKPGKADDRCCRTDELCVKGKCCGDNIMGTRKCDGKCCPQAACCNDGQKCCDKGEVCATKTEGDPHESCVPANRACPPVSNCFPGEVCHAGKCCSGNRVCQNHLTMAPVCCNADECCEFPGTFAARCTPVNTTTSAYRGHRVRT